MISWSGMTSERQYIVLPISVKNNGFLESSSIVHTFFCENGSDCFSPKNANWNGLSNCSLGFLFFIYENWNIWSKRFVLFEYLILFCQQNEIVLEAICKYLLKNSNQYLRMRLGTFEWQKGHFTPFPGISAAFLLSIFHRFGPFRSVLFFAFFTGPSCEGLIRATKFWLAHSANELSFFY